MLRIVLVNLISNVIKFTRLRAQETESVIFVRDNGVGFGMNYMDKLFDIFKRLH